jgi:hypothetical protein
MREVYGVWVWLHKLLSDQRVGFSVKLIAEKRGRRLAFIATVFPSRIYRRKRSSPSFRRPLCNVLFRYIVPEAVVWPQVIAKPVYLRTSPVSLPLNIHIRAEVSLDPRTFGDNGDSVGDGN